MGIYTVNMADEFERELGAVMASGALAAAASTLIGKASVHWMAGATATFVFSLALATRLGLGNRSKARLVLGTAAGSLAALSLLFFASRYRIFAAMLFGCLVNSPLLTESRGRKDKVHTLLCSALTGYAASLVYGWFLSSAFLTELLPFLALQLVAGAAFGFFTGIGVLPLFLNVERDKVEQLYGRTRKVLRGESAEQARCVLELYRKICSSFRTHRSLPETLLEEVKDAVESTSLRALQLINILQQVTCCPESSGLTTGDGPKPSIREDRAATRKEEITKSIRHCLEILERIELTLTGMGLLIIENDDSLEEILRFAETLSADVAGVNTAAFLATCSRAS